MAATKDLLPPDCMVQRDPYREDVLEHLMDTYNRSGRRNEALRPYARTAAWRLHYPGRA